MPGIEKIINRALGFLSDLFPKKSYLYFPLLSSSLVWVVRRVKEWRAEIFSWKTWPDPRFIENKPEDYVLYFFRNNPDLAEAYDAELRAQDQNALRNAFSRLYPILGIEDTFLYALFYEEIKSNNFRKIVEEFDDILIKARKDVEFLEGNSQLLDELKSMGEEMASLGLHLLSENKILDLLEDSIRKSLLKEK
jgi:hypothetical protein